MQPWVFAKVKTRQGACLETQFSNNPPEKTILKKGVFRFHMRNRVGICKLCGRPGNRLEFHHVLPKRHGGGEKDIIPLHRECHRDIEVVIKKMETLHGKGWENKMTEVEYFQLMRTETERLQDLPPTFEETFLSKQGFYGGKRSKKSVRKPEWWK